MKHVTLQMFVSRLVPVYVTAVQHDDGTILIEEMIDDECYSIELSEEEAATASAMLKKEFDNI